MTVIWGSCLTYTSPNCMMAGRRNSLLENNQKGILPLRIHSCHIPLSHDPRID